MKGSQMEMITQVVQVAFALGLAGACLAWFVGCCRSTPSIVDEVVAEAEALGMDPAHDKKAIQQLMRKRYRERFPSND